MAVGTNEDVEKNTLLGGNQTVPWCADQGLNTVFCCQTMGLITKPEKSIGSETNFCLSKNVKKGTWFR